MIVCAHGRLHVRRAGRIGGGTIGEMTVKRLGGVMEIMAWLLVCL